MFLFPKEETPENTRSRWRMSLERILVILKSLYLVREASKSGTKEATKFFCTHVDFLDSIKFNRLIVKDDKRTNWSHSSIQIWIHNLDKIQAAILKERNAFSLYFCRIMVHSHWQSLTQRLIPIPWNSVVNGSRSVGTLLFSSVQSIYFSVSVWDSVSVSVKTPW